MNTDWRLIPFSCSSTSCPGRPSLWDDWSCAESGVSELAPLPAVQGLAQDQHCSAAEDVAVFISVLLPCEERSPYGQLWFAYRFPVNVARLARSWVELWVAAPPPLQRSLSALVSYCLARSFLLMGNSGRLTGSRWMSCDWHAAGWSCPLPFCQYWCHSLFGEGH